MTKVGIGAVMTAAVGVLVGIVVGMSVILYPAKSMDPEYLSTDFVEEVLGNTVSNAVEPVNGSIDSVQIGGNVTQLVAVPDDGYVFGYWQVSSENVNNPNLKLTTDKTLRVDTYRANEFTPIFIAESNVVDIQSIEDSKLVQDINNNATQGKIYNLLNDCTLSEGFEPQGKFCGILKGNGHKVLGVDIAETDAGTGTGLWAELDGAVISELILASGSITSVRQNVGSIAGVMTGSLLSRCVSNISVVGTHEESVVGGIVGKTTTATSMVYCCEFGGTACGMKVSAVLGDATNTMFYKNKYKGAIL